MSAFWIVGAIVVGIFMWDWVRKIRALLRRRG